MEPFSPLRDRIQLLDQEQLHEMDELVRLRTGDCTKDEESFNDHYPVDRLLEL